MVIGCGPDGATYLEVLAELDQLGHALVHLVLDDGLALLREPLLFVGHEVAEGWDKVGRGLLSCDVHQLEGRQTCT
jgi:hypothetical protein